MPRERKNIFSHRPYRSEQATKDRILHARLEEARKRTAASSSNALNPWEDPDFPVIIEPEAVVEEKSYARRSAAPPSRTVVEQQNRSRLLEAIDLKRYIELRHGADSVVSTKEADERYAEDLALIDDLITGMREHPGDSDLIERIQTLEKNYRPRH